MTFVPVMWSVWGVLVADSRRRSTFIARGLTNDEEDQIFLDDSFSHEQAAQAAIVAKVNKLQPLLRIRAGWYGRCDGVRGRLLHRTTSSTSSNRLGSDRD